MLLTIVQPSIGKKKKHRKYIKTWLMEPLSPAVLAALTPKDIKIEFYDDRLESIPFDRKTDLVCISIETYTAKRSYQIASEYRKRGVPVIMGGFHATLAPEEVSEYAESTVIGEAENIWKYIMRDFKNNNLKKFYKQEGRVSLEGIRPDRSIFKEKKYLKLALVESGRGCQFKCDFCAIQSYFKSTHVRRPVTDIISEIMDLKKDNRNFIFFVDDNITGNLNQAKELYKALIPLKIKWVSQGSINMAFDNEFLQLLKDSGCVGVLIGFETLNAKTLQAMNKGFNEMNGGFVSAISNLNKYGIRLYPTFMFGYPDDDANTFKETVEFAINNKFFLSAFNHLLPFPGTPLYKRLMEENKLLYNKWWLDTNYKFGDCPIKGSKLSGDEIKNQCIKARKKFYSFPSILKRLMSTVNCPDIASIILFLSLNILFRKEIDQRIGLPLGDLSYGDKLVKATHND